MANHADHAEHHIVPKRIYFAVFFALIVLTWVTTYVSTVDLGRWNIFVALAIAIFKASLVVLFFMHVWYSTRLTKMIVMRQYLLADSAVVYYDGGHLDPQLDGRARPLAFRTRNN